MPEITAHFSCMLLKCLLFTVFAGLQVLALDCSNYNPIYRLPKNVIPTHYDVVLKIDLERFTFSGVEEITVNFLESNVMSVSLNVLNITVGDVLLKSADQALMSTRRSYDIKKEAETYYFAESIKASTGTLRLSFTGNITDAMEGLYKSSIKREDNSTSYLAVTQFEPISARRAIPVFDEPALKATYQVSLIVKKGLTALSNTNEVSRQDFQLDKSYDVVKFAQVPRMSSYLLAAVVGELAFVEAHTKTGIKVRIYAPVQKVKLCQFAVNVAVRSLEFYEEFFAQPYPLPKMDMVAIPDFSAGAMENWGLVTYRETALLIADDASFEQKFRVVTVITHELAHQWFGNLVTMSWWTDLWLNEGFAQYFMYYAAGKLYPGEDVNQRFITDALLPTMPLDALDSSHPIEVQIEDAKKINDYFDVISYKKGAYLIRMLHDWIGDEKFREGLRLYMKQHKYGNTCTKDLWSAFETVAKQPVEEVMASWTSQKGFPLVTVKEVPGNEPEKVSFELFQEKFVADNVLEKFELHNYWKIPTKVTSNSGETYKVLLNRRSQRLDLPASFRGQFIKLNANAFGYYRVKYSDSLLERLKSGLRSKELNEIDRLQLQDDMFALARSGYEDTTKFLDFLTSYTDEDSYFVWMAIDSAIVDLALLMPKGGHFKNYVRKLYEKAYEKVRWDRKPLESQTTADMRALVIARLGRNGHEHIIAEAKKRFAEHFSGSRPIDPELRGAIYRVVAANSNSAEFERFFDMYKSTNSTGERELIGASMASTTVEEQINSVIQFAMSEAVRSQDCPLILLRLAQTSLGCQLTWNYVKENQKVIFDRYENSGLFKAFAKIPENLVTDELADEVDAFYKKHLKDGSKVFEQSVERIRVKAKWLRKDGELIRTYLEQFSKQ